MTATIAPDTATPDAPWLTLAQTAVRLNVSVSTVRRLVAGSQLPARQVGGQWRVRPVDLDLAFPPAAGWPVELAPAATGKAGKASQPEARVDAWKAQLSQMRAS